MQIKRYLFGGSCLIVMFKDPVVGTSIFSVATASGLPMRFPSKTSLLSFLRSIDYPVGTVLDVGAHAETIDLRLAFPDRRHILFEPATEFHEALARNYSDVDHVIVPVALSDNDGSGKLRKFAIDGGGISHAGLLASDDGGPSELIEVARLDTLLKDADYQKPYLLKIDVDGFELPIFRGSEAVLDDVSVIIMEATVDTFVDRLNAIAGKGFKFFDIIDQCYFHGIMSQVDLVFLSEKYMDHPEFHPWTSKAFDWKDWNPISRFESVALQSAQSPGP